MPNVKSGIVIRVVTIFIITILINSPFPTLGRQNAVTLYV